MAFEVLAAEIDTTEGIATLRGLEGLFENAVSAILGLGGIVLFVMLLVGGLKYITSGGDPKGIEEARKTLTYAIAGLVLLAMAYLILRFIKEFTGVDVTQFRVFQKE